MLVEYTHNKKGPIGKCAPTWINLDNGAEGSVFSNPELLTDIHDGKAVTLSTVAGTKRLKTWGKYRPIAILYDPDGDINLLSQHDLERNFVSLDYLFEDRKYVCTLRGTGEVLEFTKFQVGEFGQENKLYAYVPEPHRLYLTLASENESKFSRDEIQRARGVRELKMRLGGASDRDLIQFLLSGVAVGCPYTPDDVRRASLIYGPDVAGLRGKMTAGGPKKATILELGDIGESRSQSLFVDIFEVAGQPFILAVMKPLHYRFCAILDEKHAEDTRRALRAILDIITSKGFVIKRIEIDPERALTAIKDQLGVDIQVTGAGSHVDMRSAVDEW